MARPKERNAHINYRDTLKTRVSGFWNVRVAQTWNGKNLLRGRTPTDNSILVNHSDYLGMDHEDRIKEAQIASLKDDDTSTLMSSVFLNGDNPQAQLETEFAHFLKAETAIITQSGYAANIGLLQAISGPGVPVYIDFLAHMSLWQGIHIAKADPRPFPHNNTSRLRRQIKAHGPGVVIIDSVFSTDGSVAPILEITELCERTGCVLIVDESHSLGTHGPKGAGMVVELGLEDRVAFRTASLAKAFAGRAGLIVASREFKDFHHYFLSESYPAIFSSTLLNHEIAGLRATLTAIKGADKKRALLKQRASYLRDGLRSIGFGINSKCQIIAIEAGAEDETMKVRDRFEQRGIFGAPFAPPATPNNRSALRISVHTGLTKKDLNRILSAAKEIYEETSARTWSSTRRFQNHLDTKTVKCPPGKNHVKHYPHLPANIVKPARPGNLQWQALEH